jgi:hypothetical protein
MNDTLSNQQLMELACAERLSHFLLLMDALIFGSWSVLVFTSVLYAYYFFTSKVKCGGVWYFYP